MGRVPSDNEKSYKASSIFPTSVCLGAYRLKRDKINRTVGRSVPHCPSLS